MPSSKATAAASPSPLLPFLPRKPETPSCANRQRSILTGASTATSDTGQKPISRHLRSTASVRFIDAPSPPSTPCSNSVLASWAESTVGKALEDAGWTVLARNYRWVGCEVDIIAKKGDTVLGVEVKCRSHAPRDMTSAIAILPFKKASALTRGMQAWIVRNRTKARNIRVDLGLLIVPAKLRRVCAKKDATAVSRLRLYWFTDVVTLK